MSGKEFITVAKATAREFGRDDVGYLAAAVTYYAFFSLFPLVLLSVILVSLFLNATDAREFIFQQVGQYAPGMAKFLDDAVTEAVANRHNVGLPALISLVTLIFTASGAFDALDKSINRAWNTEKVRSLVGTKLLSFALMLLVALMMLASAALSVVLTSARTLSTRFFGEVPGSQAAWTAINLGASLALVFVGFLIIYRYVPRANITVRDVWLAAFLAALVWSVAKEIFALYLGSTFVNYSAVYGTVGTVIALLTWIYVSSIIVLTGAEFASETAIVRALRAHVALPPPTEGESGGNQEGEQATARAETSRSPWFR